MHIKFPIFVNTIGEIKHVQPANGESFKLKELQDLLNAETIEVLRPKKIPFEVQRDGGINCGIDSGKFYMIVDENGITKNLTPNHVASECFGREVVGNVLFVSSSSMK